MKKKAQISIYVIIGILVLIVLSSLFFVKQTAQETQLAQSQYVFEMGPKQSSLESLIGECVKQNVIQGEILYGLRRDWSPDRIKSYIEQKLPTCIDSFAKEQKYKTNYGEINVGVEIDQEALMVYVNYPMEFSKKDSLLRFEQQEYKFPRTVMETIYPSKTTRIVSADGTMILEIPPGTIATLNGQQIDRVGIKQLDREFNALSNSVVAGMLAFNGIPNGVVFSKPIKITKFYTENELGWIPEEDLKIGFWNDYANTWVGIPTIVDLEKNKVTAEIQHFTPLVNLHCGVDGTVSNVVVENVIEHSIGMICEANPWRLNADKKTCSLVPSNYVLFAVSDDVEITTLGPDYGSTMIEQIEITTKANVVGQEQADDCTEINFLCTKEGCSSNPGCEINTEDTDTTNDDCKDECLVYSCNGKITGYTSEPISIWRNPITVQLTPDEKSSGNACVFMDGEFALKSEDVNVCGISSSEKCSGDTSPVNIKISPTPCSLGDSCEILSVTNLIENIVTFSYKITNGNAPDTCMNGGATIQLQGIGIIDAEYGCETDKETKCMPQNGAGKYQCNQCEEGYWVVSESATCDANGDGKIDDDDDCSTLGGNGGGGETTCETNEDCQPGQLCEEGKCTGELGGGGRGDSCSESSGPCSGVDMSPYIGMKITADKTLDTRDKKYCDSFGDLSSGTELILFDQTADIGGTCWVFVESQTQTDGFKPDLYVKYEQIKHLLGDNNETETCETDDDCEDGFYCDTEDLICKEEPTIITPEPIVGFYDFDFTEEISFEPPSLGYYTEENEIVTSSDYTWFIKLNYTNETNLSEVIEDNDEILGYWLVDTDCSDSINLSQMYLDYHSATNIPLITKMTKECAEQRLDENISFTDIIFFDYENNDSLLDIDTTVKFVPMLNVNGMSAYEINETSYNILANNYLGIIYYPYEDVIVDKYPYINSYGEAFCHAKEKFFEEVCDYVPELPEEIKIAFIANQGYNQSAYDVLALLTAQEPDLVVINGNLGYDSYDYWSDMMSIFDIPFIASIGASDKVDWEYYKPDIENNFNDDVVCEGITGDQMTCVFKGISFIISGVGTTFETQGHLTYINDSLKTDSEWKFCVWNKANKDLRISNKEDNDDLIFDYYDVCRKQGALIVTGYDMSYARTKTLASFEPITTEDNYNIEPERTIVFMSGLGGYANETYNCANHDTDTWWSTIFTENYYLNKGLEIAKSCDTTLNTEFNYGALFITINPNGEEHVAHSEFITVDETVIDSIDINNIN